MTNNTIFSKTLITTLTLFLTLGLMTGLTAAEEHVGADIGEYPEIDAEDFEYAVLEGEDSLEGTDFEEYHEDPFDAEDVYGNIDAATDEASQDDSILVFPGEYDFEGALESKDRASGMEIVSYEGPDETDIVGVDDDRGISLRESEMVLQGFTITEDATSGEAPSDALISIKGSDVEVRHNIVEAGVEVGDDPGALIRSSGLDKGETGVVIENNEFLTAGGRGIQFTGENGQSDEVTIRNNVIDAEDSSFGIAVTNSDEPEITGNTIRNSNFHGIQLTDHLDGNEKGPIQDAKINENLIEENDANGVVLDDKAAESDSKITEMSKNHLVGNGGADPGEDDGAIRITGEASLTVPADENWFGTSDRSTIEDEELTEGEGTIDFKPFYVGPELETLSNEIVDGETLEFQSEPVTINQDEALEVDLENAEDYEGEVFEGTSDVTFDVSNLEGEDVDREITNEDVDFESGEAENVEVLSDEETDNLKSQTDSNLEFESVAERTVDESDTTQVTVNQVLDEFNVDPDSDVDQGVDNFEVTINSFEGTAGQNLEADVLGGSEEVEVNIDGEDDTTNVDLSDQDPSYDLTVGEGDEIDINTEALEAGTQDITVEIADVTNDDEDITVNQVVDSFDISADDVTAGDTVDAEITNAEDLAGDDLSEEFDVKVTINNGEEQVYSETDQDVDFSKGESGEHTYTTDEINRADTYDLTVEVGSEEESSSGEFTVELAGGTFVLADADESDGDYAEEVDQQEWKEAVDNEEDVGEVDFEAVARQDLYEYVDDSYGVGLIPEDSDGERLTDEADFKIDGPEVEDTFSISEFEEGSSGYYWIHEDAGWTESSEDGLNQDDEGSYTIEVTGADGHADFEAEFELESVNFGAENVEVEQEVSDPVTAGEEFTAEAEVTDDAENPVEDVEVTVSETGDYGFDGGTTEVDTDENGIATFDDLVIEAADTGYELEFEINDEESNVAEDDSAASEEFEVEAGDAGSYDVDVEDITAGEEATINLESAEDEFSNSLEGDYTADITIDNGGTEYTSNDETISFSEGEASYTTSELTGDADSYTATVEIDDVEDDNTDEFEIQTGEVASAELDITGPLTAGEEVDIKGAISDVQDSEGNSLSEDLDVEVENEEEGNLFGETSVNFENGSPNEAVEITPTEAVEQDEFTLTIEDDVTATDEVTVQAGEADSVSVTAETDTATADDSDQLQFDVTVEDANSNPVDGVSVEATEDAEGTVNFDETTRSTDGDGEVTFNPTSPDAEEDIEFTFEEQENENSETAQATYEAGEVDSYEITKNVDEDITAGDEVNFNLEATDSEGNLNKDYAETASIETTQNDDVEITQEFESGILEFSTEDITTAVDDQEIEVEEVDEGDFTTTSSQFNIEAGEPYSVDFEFDEEESISAVGDDLTIDSNEVTNLEDEHGNAISGEFDIELENVNGDDGQLAIDETGDYSFDNGDLDETLTVDSSKITEALDSYHIQIDVDQGGAVATADNNLEVTPGDLESFEVVDGPEGTITAGDNVDVDFEAQDTHGNKVGDYSEEVTVTTTENDDIDISPSFEDGDLNVNEQVTTAEDNQQLKVDDEQGTEETTDEFTVEAAEADEFDVDEQPDSEYASGESVDFKVKALDEFDNIAEGYEEEATVKTTENDDVDESLSFSEGVLDKSVEVEEAATGQALSIEEGDLSATTEAFDVRDQIYDFTAGEWSALSAPYATEEVAFDGDGTILAYNTNSEDEVSWEVVDEEDAFQHSQRAYYVTGYDQISMNKDEEGSDTGVTVEEGWNFVGAYDNEGDNEIKDMFSPFENAADTVVYPDRNVEEFGAFGGSNQDFPDEDYEEESPEVEGAFWFHVYDSVTLNPPEPEAN